MAMMMHCCPAVCQGPALLQLWYAVSFDAVFGMLWMQKLAANMALTIAKDIQVDVDRTGSHSCMSFRLACVREVCSFVRSL